MNSNILIIFSIVLLLLICLLFALMFSYYYLLKRISKQFPAYYELLGSPFLPTASRNIVKTINRDKANYAVLGKLLRGVPEDFPVDSKLRRLALSVRIELYMVFIALGLIVSLAVSAIV